MKLETFYKNLQEIEENQNYNNYNYSFEIYQENEQEDIQDLLHLIQEKNKEIINI